MESFLWENVVKEIIRFENTILDPFGGNFWFSIVLKLSTRHPFQSNWTIVVWRIYKGKGFVWDLIEKDALLASYERFKMPFCPWSLPNCNPIGARLYANWGTIGTQLAPNWPSFTTKWIKRRGLYYFIKLLRELLLCVIRSWRTRYILWYHVYYSITYTDLS